MHQSFTKFQSRSEIRSSKSYNLQLDFQKTRDNCIPLDGGNRFMHNSVTVCRKLRVPSATQLITHHFRMPMTEHSPGGLLDAKSRAVELLSCWVVALQNVANTAIACNCYILLQQQWARSKRKIVIYPEASMQTLTPATFTPSASRPCALGRLSKCKQKAKMWALRQVLLWESF